MFTEIEREPTILTVCCNPLCAGLFDEAQGLARFCSNICRKRFMALRTVASLLLPLGKEKAWKILQEVGPFDETALTHSEDPDKGAGKG